MHSAYICVFLTSLINLRGHENLGYAFIVGTGHGPCTSLVKEGSTANQVLPEDPKMTNVAHLTELSHAMCLMSMLWLASQNSECVLPYHARSIYYYFH